MTYYYVLAGDGDQLTTGLLEYEARRVAQRMANERDELVWLHCSDDDALDEGARIDPQAPYQIDASMLGELWEGDDAALRGFADMLSKRIGRRVAVVSMARNDQDNDVSEADWNATIEESPAEWWAP